MCPTDYLLNKITSAIDRAQTVLDRELAHKRALEADRNLREEQERELRETMAIDQERMRKAKADREAKEKAEETIKAVNEFIQGDYQLFQETINGLKIKVFKEMEPVKIE